MRTLYLNPVTWDLVVDNYGNIACADNPYQFAQDVASACRLWKGEARYNTVRGIPYETALLGKFPAPSLILSWYRTEAMSVEGIESAEVTIDYLKDERRLTGQISLTTENDEQLTVTI